MWVRDEPQIPQKEYFVGRHARTTENAILEYACRPIASFAGTLPKATLAVGGLTAASAEGLLVNKLLLDSEPTKGLFVTNEVQNII